MVTTAIVKIWNQVAGAVAWDESQGIGAFEFENAFLNNNWDLSPLKMPLTESKGRIYSFSELRNNKTFKGLPGLLADVLPDKYGNTLIDAWLARRGRPSGSMNPVETLCFIGQRGMGALEFEPAYPKTANTSTKIEISDLVEIANDILTGRQNFITDLSANEEKALLDILKIGTSAGGARAKAVIAYNATTQEVRTGQAGAHMGFTHWLIKFDGVSDSQFGTSSGYGRIEMAYYLMAKAAEIEMTQCRLLEENGRAHFMTERFDRIGSKDKVHVQSFCAMQHYDFNDIGLYSYEQLFETMRLLRLSYPEAEQLFRRMVFNVLSRNCDDHTKNFAFIMNKVGEWKLSPAYDVCHSYRPGSTWVSQQSLSVNGKRNNIRKDDFIAVAKQMNIKKASNIVQQISEVVNHWNDYAEEVKVDSLLRDAIDKTLIK